MVSELCLTKLCKDCPEQVKCFGCEHNYRLIKSETVTNLYKCSKCGKKIRLEKNDACLECIWNCKGEIKNRFINETTYIKCNKFHKKDETNK